MTDRRQQFDQLIQVIEGDFHRKMDALFVLFPEFGGDTKANPVVRRAGGLGTKLGERVNKEIVDKAILKSAERVDKNVATTLTGDKFCERCKGHRITANSKACEVCGKMVCTQCRHGADRKMCRDCAVLPE